jgi:hypothetical protein
MRRSDMVNRLKTLISNLRSANVVVTDKLLAESVLAECEWNGMLPPGKPVNADHPHFLEHVWSKEPENN